MQDFADPDVSPVTTDLFTAPSGLRADAVAAAVPPSCRRPSVALPTPAREGRDVLVTLEPCTPRVPAMHLLPSFASLSGEHCAFRLELSVRAAGAWSPWIGGASIGGEFACIDTATAAAVCDIDVVLARVPVEAARLRLRLHAHDAARVLAAPWLLALSASDGTSVGDGVTRGPGARLTVPALSQMDEDPALAMRVCSPTSVAMVLAYWRRPAPVTAVASDVFHAALDRYGVWPAAIDAAARRGLAGYLLRFPDWTSAAWCLEHGLPVIASIGYATGQLTGAAISQTDGHLVVLTGYEGDDALVNDPAAPTPAAVARRYRIDELRHVWLARGGIGYVLFPPAT